MSSRSEGSRPLYALGEEVATASCEVGCYVVNCYGIVDFSSMKEVGFAYLIKSSDPLIYYYDYIAEEDLVKIPDCSRTNWDNCIWRPSNEQV